MATKKQVKSLKGFLLIHTCACMRAPLYLFLSSLYDQISRSDVSFDPTHVCCVCVCVCVRARVCVLSWFCRSCVCSDHQRTRMSVPYRQQTWECPPEDRTEFSPIYFLGPTHSLTLFDSNNLKLIYDKVQFFLSDGQLTCAISHWNQSLFKFHFSWLYIQF